MELHPLPAEGKAAAAALLRAVVDDMVGGGGPLQRGGARTLRHDACKPELPENAADAVSLAPSKPAGAHDVNRHSAKRATSGS